MTDLSSIITQVKQGETMPTRPPVLPVVPAVPTVVETPRKSGGAFGGCCGGKPKAKKGPVAKGSATTTTKLTENAAELQSVITLSTTIESTMMDDNLQIPADDKPSPDHLGLSVPGTNSAKATESDKLKNTAQTELGTTSGHSRKRKSVNDITPAATLAPVIKSGSGALEDVASSTPRQSGKLAAVKSGSEAGSNISSEATSPVPSPVASSEQAAESRKSTKIEPSKQAPKRMYFTKNENWVPGPDALLPPPVEDQYNKKLLVLDLDETLVHSSFNKVDNADMVIPLSIEDPVSKTTISHQVYVYKRPYVDEFLETMAKYYELAIFTASLQVYCDAVMEKLDPKGLCVHRLYRNSCVQSNGVFVKDMSILGRPIESIIILDNCAASYMFQPENGILAVAFYDDKTDTFLKEIEETMIRLSRVDDVRTYLCNCP